MTVIAQILLALLQGLTEGALAIALFGICMSLWGP